MGAGLEKSGRVVDARLAPAKIPECLAVLLEHRTRRSGDFATAGQASDSDRKWRRDRPMEQRACRPAAARHVQGRTLQASCLE